MLCHKKGQGPYVGNDSQLLCFSPFEKNPILLQIKGGLNNTSYFLGGGGQYSPLAIVVADSGQEKLSRIRVCSISTDVV